MNEPIFQPLPDPEPESDGETAQRELVLIKQGQRYLFRYCPGQEQQLLESLVRMVQDPGCDLDWFDAAVLSHQLGQVMSHQLDEMMKASVKSR